MSAITLKSRLSALLTATVFVLASACADPLGPSTSVNNVEQGNPNQPAANQPGQPGGYSDNGAGEDPDEHQHGNLKENVSA